MKKAGITGWGRMTDIDNHMTAGDIPEYEGDRTEQDVQAEMVRIVEDMDNDDLADRAIQASEDFHTEFWDTVRDALLCDEETDHLRSPMEQALLREFRRQIREQAENQA